MEVRRERPGRERDGMKMGKTRQGLEGLGFGDGTREEEGEGGLFW